MAFNVLVDPQALRSQGDLADNAQVNQVAAEACRLATAHLGKVLRTNFDLATSVVDEFNFIARPPNNRMALLLTRGFVSSVSVKMSTTRASMAEATALASTYLITDAEKGLIRLIPEDGISINVTGSAWRDWSTGWIQVTYNSGFAVKTFDSEVTATTPYDFKRYDKDVVPDWLQLAATSWALDIYKWLASSKRKGAWSDSIQLGLVERYIRYAPAALKAL
jgi:hypothetical protein